jgi:hypothetical protein
MPKVSDDIYNSWTLDKFDTNIAINDRKGKNYSNSTARQRADELRIERKYQVDRGATKDISGSDRAKNSTSKKVTNILRKTHIETQKELAKFEKQIQKEREIEEMTALLDDLESMTETDEQVARKLQLEEEEKNRSYYIGGRRLHRSKSKKSKKSKKYKKIRAKRVTRRSGLINSRNVVNQTRKSKIHHKRSY